MLERKKEKNVWSSCVTCNEKQNTKSTHGSTPPASKAEDKVGTTQNRNLADPSDLSQFCHVDYEKSAKDWPRNDRS